MRGDDRARVRFGRRQVPACRVPRGRLDSKANTVEAGPWVRACLSPFSLPSLCNPLSLSPSTRSFSALRAPSAAYSLRHWLARPASVPFPPRWNVGAQARWLYSTTDRQSIRRQARTFAREIVIFARPFVSFLPVRPFPFQSSSTNSSPLF